MPMCSAWDDPVLPRPGSPIRKSPDQSLLSGSPKLIAASHALRRLLVPRHPPHALSSLTIFAIATQQKLQFLPVFSCQRTSPRADARWAKSQAVTSQEPVFVVPGYSLLRGLVELIGFEPTTSGVQNRRSPN